MQVGPRLNPQLFDPVAWKQTPELELLDMHPLDPNGEANCKALFDTWKYETGVVRGEREWIFLAMDGKPVYELLKLKAKHPGEYDWIEPLRFPLHEHINNMKTFMGIYWETCLAPLAALHGYKNPVVLLHASNTHKAYDFLLVVYEAILYGLTKRHHSRQLRAGELLTPFPIKDLERMIEASTDDTFKWRFEMFFHDLTAVVGHKGAVRDCNGDVEPQKRRSAFEQLVMPMYEINDHQYYTKLNMWFAMREQEMHPEFLLAKQAAETVRFDWLTNREGERSHAQTIRPEHAAGVWVPSTRKYGKWIGQDECGENCNRRVCRRSGNGHRPPERRCHGRADIRAGAAMPCGMSALN